jgi:NAD+ synthase
VEVAERIAAWLREYASKAGLRGYVVGLSGGIDSACTAALCKRAVGDSVLGALLPCHSSTEEAEMARLVAENFGIKTVTVDLGPSFDALVEALPPAQAEIAVANIKPRLRMAALYALAQTHRYLVAGTGNRSELMVGYFTKYGDGGVDVEPLGNLYKWQVRELAKELRVPQPVIDRPPSAGLWAGQTDEDELGITYEELDGALAAILAERSEGVDPDLLNTVRGMMAAAGHKLAVPPAFPVDGH